MLRDLLFAGAGSGAIDPDSDPYWNNVKLLLRMVGSEGSNIIQDSSLQNVPITVFGAPFLTNEVELFGGSTAKIGNANYLSIAQSVAPAIGTGPFTLDFWIETSNTGEARILDCRPITTNVPFATWITASGVLTFMSFPPAVVTLVNAVVVGQLSHIEISRDPSGTLRIFVGGALLASASNPYDFTSGDWLIGRALDGTSFGSPYYLADFRVTVGVARHTTDFIPPTQRAPTK